MIYSPFEGGRNPEAFRELLVLRFKEWKRLRRNRLARRRYRANKDARQNLKPVSAP